MAEPLVSRRFDARVCQADTLELNVPTPLRLESGHVYVVRQWGTTSVAPVVVYVEHGGALHALSENAVPGTVNEATYVNPSLAEGLVVSYHARNADGTTVRTTLAGYSSTALGSNGAGYVRLEMPASLSSGRRILLRTSNPGSNFARVDLVEPMTRVRTGDYVWMEVEQQTRSTNGWVDTYHADAETSAARLVLSVDLRQDTSIPEADVF